MERKRGRGLVGLVLLLAWGACAFALDPSQEVNQYAHTAWTVRNGFSMGNIYAMAQTPDGYLWFGTEFGLYRFDGVRSIRWQPPASQDLPDKNINSLLVTRDGTLWIGTFSGLVTWSGGKLTPRPEPELRRQFVSSLYEDREGTVWVGTLGTPTGQLCAIRSGRTQCYGDDGAFGRAVWALYEDSSGNLWAAAQSGLWRMKPGPPRLYPTSTELIGLNQADNGRLLIAVHGSGLMQLVDESVKSYQIRGAMNSNRLLQDRDIDANRLLRDRDGGLWIGAVERGLIHVHHGRTDVFTKADGLSGDVIFSLFEDSEGTIWVSTNGGLDRFNDLAASTISVRQGLSTDAAWSILATRDDNVWIGTGDGLNRWNKGQISTIHKASGPLDDVPQSLFQDDRGRIWTFTRHGLAYLENSELIPLSIVAGGKAHYITGDRTGNLWLSEEKSLLHLLEGRLVEQIPWSEVAHHQSAQVLLSGREPGGVWLGFWVDGGVLYFKNGQVRASYTAANGLGEGRVADLRLDRDGTLWVATQGGLSRLKDGRIATLTSRNGLPCDTIHWTMEDDYHSFWLYTACGLVRITQSEMDAWVTDPQHKVQSTVWDATDGIRLRSTAASGYGPRVAKSTDGKLWFVTGEGVQVVDPGHLPFNKLEPPVHIEQVIADRKIYSATSLRMGAGHLPPLVRDLEIDYTALSFVVPEKNLFRYKLENVDRDWRDAGNRRQAFYTNLSPGKYHFRVIACNNSGVWNEEGASLDFSIVPAYYQTNWFRTLCVGGLLTLFWVAHRLRIRALERHQTEIRAMNEQLIRAQEAERMRIAGELHDGVLQQMTSLAVGLGTVKYQLPPGSETRAMVSGMEQRLVQIGTDIRHLSHELHPALLQEAGLPAALSAYCEEFSKVRGLPVACQIDGSVEELSPGAALCLYRIAQEALGNAAKYSEAKRVEVRLTRSDGRVFLSVSDDGVGCTPDQIGKAGGLGLINMRERVLQLDGTFEFDSKPGRGTTMKVAIPFRTDS